MTRRRWTIVLLLLFSFAGALGVYAGGIGSVAIPTLLRTIDGTVSGVFPVIKVTNGALTNNGDGSATLNTGSGLGNGDVSSNTATSVANEVVLFDGTGGKTVKRATLTAPVVNSTAGVLGTATADTDYATPTGAGTLSNKTLDNTTTANLKDTLFTLQDNGSATKQAQFELSNITAGQTRSINVPDASSTTVQPNTGAANEFVTAISAQGVVSRAQPAFSNLSGTAADAQIPDLNALSTGLATGKCVQTNDTTGLLEVAAGACGTTSGGLPDTGANGIVVRNSATPTTVNRTITGTSNQIDVTNGDGVAGNPTLKIPDAGATMPGTTAGTFHGTLTVTPGQYVDATLADATAPNTIGTALPESCASGQTFIKTDAAAGQKYYICTAALAWEVQGGSGASSFDQLGSGENTTATMQVGTGASLAPSGSGTVTANVVSPGATVGAQAGTTGSMVFRGTTSGAVTLSVGDAAGTYTLKLPNTDGDAGQYLKTDGSGNTSWDTPAGSGTVNTGLSGHLAVYPGDGTTVDDAANATLSAGALTLGASGTVGSVTMGNATSGTITLAPVAGALGTPTVSLPAETGTVCTTGSVCTGYQAALDASGVVALFATGACTGALMSDTTCDALDAASLISRWEPGCSGYLKSDATCDTPPGFAVPEESCPSAGTLTPTSTTGINYCYTITGAFTITTPGGTPSDGDRLLFVLKNSTGSAHAITLNNTYYADTGGVGYPTTTPPNTSQYQLIAVQYNAAASKYLVVGNTYESVYAPDGLRIPPATTAPNCEKIGQTYAKTDGPTGQKLYVCTATGTPGTWELQAGSGDTPGGSDGQVQYRVNSATLGGSAGATFDSAAQLTRREKSTVVTTDTTLGAHLHILADTGSVGAVAVTVPVPSAATTGHIYTVTKITTDANALSLVPDTTVTLLGATDTLACNAQYCGWHLRSVSATDWLVESYAAGGGIQSVTSSPYTITASDALKMIVVDNASATTVNIPQATAAGFGTELRLLVINLGAGTATLTPATSTINGAATLDLATGDSAIVTSDATNYYAAHTVSAAPGGAADSVPAELAITGDMTHDLTSAGVDLAPTGITTATVLRITLSSGSQEIRSIGGTADGKVLVVQNADASDLLTLKHEYTSGTTAAMRLALPYGRDIILPPGGTVTLLYNATDSRWNALALPNRNPRISTATSASSLTPDITAFSHYVYTALAADLTIAIPTGTPHEDETLTFDIASDSSSHTLTFTTGTNGFAANLGIAAPASIAANGRVLVVALWTATDAKWNIAYSNVGVVRVANGGTGADMSATGGTGHIVKQASAGAAFTTGPLASTDLSDTTAIVRNNAGNTYSTGAQDFGSATSLKVPTGAGAAPTASGLVAYDSTLNTFTAGVNTANRAFVLGFGTDAQNGDFTVTAAHFSLYRTISHTASGSQTFTLPGAGSLPPDGQSVQVLNYGAGALVLTTTANMNGSGSDITLAGGAVDDPSTAWIISSGGSNYHVFVRQSNASYAATTKTLTNTTYSAEGTGNVLTTISYLYLYPAGCPDGATPVFMADADATGETVPAAACNDTGTFQRPSADFSGSAVNSLLFQVPLPPDWSGNLDLTIRYVSVAASPTGNVEWDISTACRATGESWDTTFNTAQTITDAVGSQNQPNDATQTTLTVTGCAAGEDMMLKISRDGTNDTNNDLAKMLWTRLKMRRSQTP